MRRSEVVTARGLELLVPGAGFKLNPLVVHYYKKLIPVSVFPDESATLTLVANSDDIGPAYHAAVLMLGQDVYDAWTHHRPQAFDASRTRDIARAILKNVSRK